MRKLPHPPLRAYGVFAVCALSVQDLAHRTRLLGALDAVQTAEQNYLALGAVAQLFQFPAISHVGEWVAGAEMETLYTQTLSRQESTARPYYDAMRGSAPNNICPYCGQRTVSTLDHYLPKSIHPALAVTPINLVPACSECNKVKLDFQPPTAKDQILHPYFDDVSAEVWLNASVQDVAGRPVLEFFAAPPKAWPVELANRLDTHLRRLKLPALYASHAAEELVNNREALQKLRNAGGPNGVRLHCLEQEQSLRSVHRNNWQAAYYRALAISDWFCELGVLAIEASQRPWPVDPTAAIQALAQGAGAPP